MTTEALDARTPDTVDAEELTDAVARARGSVWGHRVTHPKGVLLTGTFTASPRARELTRAVHMQGDYLMTGIVDELPVRYVLRAQLAEEGDPVDDATIAYPAERRWVDMGVIELTGPDLERERDGDLLVNDPMRLTDGIEPSDDPILHVRPRVYDRSIRRRNGTPRPDEQQ